MYGFFMSSFCWSEMKIKSSSVSIDDGPIAWLGIAKCGDPLSGIHSKKKKQMYYVR